MSNKHSLRITEIFYSLQGETRTVGLPTVFVRLTGCPLRCQYCDTAYAFQGGFRLSLDDVLNQVASFKASYVTVSGGEPLAQSDVYHLMTLLCDSGYKVSLETSGALSVKDVDARVMKVVDFKTPGSHEVERNDFNNVEYLTSQDQVKFVVCNREDYEWSIDIMHKYKLQERCEVLFSPSYHDISPDKLAQWILNDRLKVRFQLQLHKYIWGDKPGV